MTQKPNGSVQEHMEGAGTPTHAIIENFRADIGSAGMPRPTGLFDIQRWDEPSR